MFAHVQVKSVFQVLQGFETSFLYWDDNVPGYREKSGVYVAHLSLTGLGSMLNPFLFAATCLKHAEIFVGKVRTCRRRIPTLDAFASSVDSWLTVSEVPIQDMHSFL
jgi:gamma-tubulin complex component 5